MPWLSNQPDIVKTFTRIAPVQEPAPLDDVHAWHAYWRHRWVYDRPELFESLGMRWGPAGTVPARFPCVVVPSIDLTPELNGRVWRGPAEPGPRPGEIWMPLHAGIEQVVDVALEAGQPQWHALSRLSSDGTWHVTDGESAPPVAEATAWCRRELENMTGAVAVRMVGNAIVAVSLCPTASFLSAYGHDFPRALAKLHDSGRWSGYHGRPAGRVAAEGGPQRDIRRHRPERVGGRLEQVRREQPEAR